MNAQLTNTAKSILNNIYEEYLDKLKNGLSAEEANNFANRFDEKCKSLSVIPEGDANAALEELDETNFTKYIDILGDFKLTSCAISYMENRYANGIKQMIDVAKKVIS